MAEGLVGRGHEAVAMSRKGSNTSLLRDLGVELIHGDVTDAPSLVCATKDVDSIIHLAAYYTFFGRKDIYERVNVEGTRNLISSAMENGVTRFIHCSSTEAIGPVENPPGNELTPPRPAYDYGRSKLASERVVESYGSLGLDYTIMRPSGIYGPRNIDDVAFWTIVSYAKNALGTRFYIGPGESHVQFCHVNDIVEGFMLALEKPELSSGRTYIISDERAYTYREVYALLSEITGRKGPSLHLPKAIAKAMILPIESYYRLARKSNFLYCTSTVEAVTSERSYCIDRIRDELGFRPRYDLRTGLAETVEWYKDNGYI